MFPLCFEDSVLIDLTVLWIAGPRELLLMEKTAAWVRQKLLLAFVDAGRDYEEERNKIKGMQ